MPLSQHALNWVRHHAVLQNVNQALANVDAAGELHEKAERLTEQSNHFSQQAKDARKHFCIKDLKVRPGHAAGYCE